MSVDPAAMLTRPSLLIRLRDAGDADACGRKPSFHPHTWRAFECVWLENRSAAETALELSLDIDAVYTAKSRVLKRLSEEVEEIAGGFSWLDSFETP